jgi:ketosteroid isomerase-like protein
LDGKDALIHYLPGCPQVAPGASARGVFSFAVDFEEKKNLIERYLRAYNDMDIEGMVAWMDPDCSFENRSGDQVTVSTQGIAPLRALAEKTKAVFSSRSQKITALREEGEDLIVDIDFEGLLRVDLPNGSRAGERVQLSGKSIFQFRDGLISHITDISESPV